VKEFEEINKNPNKAKKNKIKKPSYWQGRRNKRGTTDDYT
jgi:hypothetical protein